MKWKRATQGFIDEPILEYLEKLFDEQIEKGHKLRVAVGTDSQVTTIGYNFATVILVITEGSGGMIIGATYHDPLLPKGKKGINQRMIKEVSKSIEVAYEISELLDLYEIPLEIHADNNPNIARGASNVALSEAAGYILGMGYEFKIKPDAWAASSCADSLC